MDEAVCQSRSRRVQVIQVSHGTTWCHCHLHSCILGIKHYHFKFTHTLNQCKWLYKEKEGIVATYYIQDLELKAIFSTGLGKVIKSEVMNRAARIWQSPQTAVQHYMKLPKHSANHRAEGTDSKTSSSMQVKQSFLLLCWLKSETRDPTRLPGTISSRKSS